MARWTDLAEWVGPTPNQSGAMVEQRGLVLHIAQGSFAGTISWQRNPSADVSSHFIVAKDGRCAQMVDTNVTAWTQAAGNGHWISVENEGFSGEPLTPQQVEAAAKLYARGVFDYGWPLQAADSPAGRGLGWHGMGGTAWGGHVNCPGEPIKAQRPAILARAAQLLGQQATSQEDDMAAIVRIDDGPARYLTNGLFHRLLFPEADMQRAIAMGAVVQDAEITPLAYIGRDIGTVGGGAAPAPVAEATVKAALLKALADPAVKAALAEAAFQGSQRAEKE